MMYNYKSEGKNRFKNLKTLLSRKNHERKAWRKQIKTLVLFYWKRTPISIFKDFEALYLVFVDFQLL